MTNDNIIDHAAVPQASSSENWRVGILLFSKCPISYGSDSSPEADLARRGSYFRM